MFILCIALCMVNAFKNFRFLLSFQKLFMIGHLMCKNEKYIVMCGALKAITHYFGVETMYLFYIFMWELHFLYQKG